MALLLRVIRVALGSVARVLGLFAALFLAYLVWTRAWPAYRATTHLAAQRPQLQQLVDELERDLAKRQMTIDQIEGGLSELSRQQQRKLEEQVSELEVTLQEESDQLQRLADELATAIAEQEKYCRTWNPVKRWMCREVEARTNKTREVVEPLLRRATESREQMEQRLRDAESALHSFVSEGLLERARGSDALLLRAARAEQTNALKQTRAALVERQDQLRRAIEADLSPWAWLERELLAVGPQLLLIVVLVLLTPWLQRTVLYFVFMPLVERAKLLQLTSDTKGRISANNGKRSLTLVLSPGEKCWARADYVRPVEGCTSSQWLYDIRAPLVSYAAGLSILTRIEAPGDTAREVTTTLASPLHADSYLSEVTLERSDGLIFHPRHLVAVLGDVELWTTWRIRSWHAWATGQLRYIGVRGTGRCVLEGFGDLVVATVADSRQKIEQELVVAFDARLQYGTARTETFLPYLLGRTPLVDDVFVGSGVYLWQKNTRRHQRSFTERTFDVFFGAVSKLLGF